MFSVENEHLQIENLHPFVLLFIDVFSRKWASPDVKSKDLFFALLQCFQWKMGICRHTVKDFFLHFIDISSEKWASADVKTIFLYIAFSFADWVPLSPISYHPYNCTT